MKKTALFLVLAFATSLAFAQQKYHVFSINGKYGITDTLGNEAIKPSYSYRTLVTAKSQIYLQDFSEKPDIIFDAKTGSKQLYESVYNNKLTLKDEPFSIVSTKNKKFLLSETTSKTIPLTRDYDSFENVGQYIIATYYAQDPFVSGGKDKNGRFLPPKIREIKKRNVVLSNDETLKTVLNTGFDKFLPLYKVPKEKAQDDKMEVRTVEITLPLKRTSRNFDYIVLSQGNNHKLYNHKMVLLKAFVLSKPNEEKLLDFCKKTIKIDVDNLSSGDHGMMVSAPPMGPSSGRRDARQMPEEKKPFKPFFYTKKLENGNTIFCLQETEEISKCIFEADAKTKVRLYERDANLRITIDGKEDSEFSYHPKTGEIYLPKTYLTELGIKLT